MGGILKLKEAQINNLSLKNMNVLAEIFPEFLYLFF